jgi:histidinol-phosphate/aromatic aminotransferase/cobyric acid decarboxylase-like protein
MRKKKIYIRGNFKEKIENYIRISLGPVNKMKIFIEAFDNWLKIRK